jgi:predicted nucleic acid-binding protein
VAELWHGVERAPGAHKTKRERYLRTILEMLPIIPYTELTAFEARAYMGSFGVVGHNDWLL